MATSAGDFYPYRPMSTNEGPVPKIHPATREVLPDDPLNLHGVEVPGDPKLMLRLLVEEYARMGSGVDEIMRLARDPFYQSFHGLYRLLGEQQFRQEINDIGRRCGVIRVRTRQAEPPPEQLIQITPLVS